MFSSAEAEAKMRAKGLVPVRSIRTFFLRDRATAPKDAIALAISTTAPAAKDALNALRLPYETAGTGSGGRDEVWVSPDVHIVLRAIHAVQESRSFPEMARRLARRPQVLGALVAAYRLAAPEETLRALVHDV